MLNKKFPLFFAIALTVATNSRGRAQAPVVPWTAADISIWHGTGRSTAAARSLVNPIAAVTHSSLGMGSDVIVPAVAWKDWRFSAYCDTGKIYVEQTPPSPLARVAIIQTGLAGISNLSLARVPWIPENILALLIVGFDANLDTHIKVFVCDHATGIMSGILTTWPTDLGLLPSEKIVSAALLHDGLYVFDAASCCVTRFIDSNSDLIPDLRSPTFCVSLLPPPGGQFRAGRYGVVAFSHSPGMVLRVHQRGEPRINRSGESAGIVADPQSQNGLRFDPAVPPTPISIPPSFHGHLVAGATSVRVRGASLCPILVEAAANASGPWSARANFMFPQTATLLPVESVPLGSALVAGEWLRITDTANNLIAEPALVGAARPYLDRASVSGSSGTALSLTGANLSGPVSYRVLGSPAQSLNLVVAPDGRSATVDLPSTPSTLIGFATVGPPGLEATLFLTVRP